MLSLDVGSGNENHASIRLDIKRSPAVNILGDACFLPFQNKRFDFAICSNVLEHIQNWRQALSELIRVSKRVLVEVPVNSDIRKTDIFRLLIPTPQNLKLFFSLKRRAKETLWQFRIGDFDFLKKDHHVSTTINHEWKKHYFSRVYQVTIDV